MLNIKSVPLALSGPILRRVTAEQFCLWLATSETLKFRLSLFDSQGILIQQLILSFEQCTSVQIGAHAVINLIQVRWPDPLSFDDHYYYDVEAKQGAGWQSLVKLYPELLYENEPYLSFKVPKKISKVLHGSCRKPHYSGDDGLCVIDNMLADAISKKQNRPDLLMLTGDQAYVDDVAGPMLFAIHQVINKLGLFDECWQGAEAISSKELLAHQYCYYQREKLLPFDDENETLYQLFLAGKRKPIFTSANARNHLVTLSEVFAMYLLIWSPRLWTLVELDMPAAASEFSEQYEAELEPIKQFVQGLPAVERALAHIPSYMIFDDHDVTDDWNLTRQWEEVAYGHPYSKRIIGNALIGYWLCQGWGNDPDSLEDLNRHLPEHFSTRTDEREVKNHDQLIDRLLHWSRWHYSLDTEPAMLVLDTRTQRWRCETNPNRPSGLMDWESLSDLQQALIGKKAVILVTAAPIFGVKLIEAVQRVFTFFGKPLMVDAENWMAHRGTASVILNIFRTPITPPRFVILSGDVHYSFVFDVRLRFRKELRHIVQITSSGLKNRFPDGLLKWMDRLNQFFYARRSPLNFFTKRRVMDIRARRPEGQPSRTLLNQCGLGVVEFDGECRSVTAKLVDGNGTSHIFKNDDLSKDNS